MLDRSVALERLVVALIPLLVVWGIWSFGIWDPWELEAADAARAIRGTEDAAPDRAPLTTWMIGAAFETLGVREWSGRLPGVVSGLLTCVLAFWLLRTYHSRRAGLIAVVIVATTPLFLLNARLMMGAGAGFFTQAWVAAAAFSLCSSRQSGRRAIAQYALLAAGIALSTLASGVLLGPLPPILAVGAWTLLANPEQADGADWLGRGIVLATGVVMIAGVVRAVAQDAPTFSLWLGGGAVGGNPPTYEKAAELIFHGFAPWSAALPIAAVWVLAPRRQREATAQNLGWMLLLWASFSYVSWTVFASRYGTPAYLAVVPLAGVVAIWMSEVTRAPMPRWPAAVVVVLLTGLLIRDYALYPASPLRGLATDGLQVPTVFNPSGQWSLLFGAMAALLSLMLISADSLPRPRPSEIQRWLRDQWTMGWVQRGWLSLAALALAACLLFGLLCFLLDLRLASVVIRVGKAAFFVPFVLAVLVFGLPWLRYGYALLWNSRALPVLLGGLAVGAYVGLSFQPALSQHFSPKPIYETYRELTEGRREPLASYRLPSAAAHYYTEGPTLEIDQQADLLDYLEEPGQRWVVMPADRLPEVNRAYRRKTGQHLYVADARSARLILVAALPLQGRPNQSFIANNVLTEAPVPQHSVNANYDDRIELVGYDLEMPGETHVGAGQRFKLTWYWRVIGKPPSGYKVFVHIDGHGQRLNGDHVPVGERYPIMYWESGDVIVDEQELTVPANYRTSDYVIYVGFFSGEKRLEVKSGPSDGNNRLHAGVLPVR